MYMVTLETLATKRQMLWLKQELRGRSHNTEVVGEAPLVSSILSFEVSQSFEHLHCHVTNH